jgi:hypothetical protein
MTAPFSLRRLLASAPLWALAGILLCAASSRAQEPPARPHRKENRFLFVIDTSSAMKDRRNGVEEAVMGLLESGMRGELRKGDTIGVWTYSDRLNTDFPMQVWSDQKKEGIMNDVRDRLRDLHYEKRAHLDKALPQINQVVAHSERLTIIFVFDGTGVIKGTPFDKDINDLHKQYAREFRAAHEPFVTVLAARNGAAFDYTINYPGTVVVPQTTDPLPPPETNAPPLVAASTPPPVEITLPPTEPKPPLRPKIEINVYGSNYLHKATAPAPADNSIVAAVTPTPAPVPAPAPAQAPTPTPTPAPPVVPNAPSPAVVPNSPAPVEAAPVAVQTAKTNVTPPEPERAVAPAASTPPPAPLVTTPPKPVPDAPAHLAAPAAPAAVAVSTSQQAAMFVMAFSLLTIAVVLVVFLVRRSRGGPPSSLISQSIDRSR